MKLPISLLDKAAAEFPADPSEVKTFRDRIAKATAIELDGPHFVEARRTVIVAATREKPDMAFERYIGTNDLLSVNYLLTGLLQSRAVGRLCYHDRREGKTATATGFLISPDLLITNHHVFPAASLDEFNAFVLDPTVEFGFEFDLHGRRKEPIVYDLDPAAFLHTFEELDLALVAVKRIDRTGRRQLSEQGYLILNGAVATAGRGDFATIIQHADGREKQIALRNNDILDVEKPDVIIYKSDTAQGSSGAPVFNDEWQLIALHSAGVADKDAKGNYIDKDGQVVPVFNGRIEEHRVVWRSNRGIRVSSIMKYLRSTPWTVQSHAMIQVLFNPAYTDSPPFDPSAPRLIDGELASVPSLETILAPPATNPPVKAVPISIHINIGSDSRVTLPERFEGIGHFESQFEFEKRVEDAMDFSRCAGFQEHFMGEHIAMPVPTTELRKLIAFQRYSTGNYLLKYHHISTIHHAVRRVPVVSAVNVNGKNRYGELDEKGARVDRWFRDNRLAYEEQLDDAWYAKSGFDRGHLARREDAEWGDTVGLAKLAADMTCSYANAVPQVPALNRARFGYHGAWGKLEEMLLEEGVESENGKSGRICIFAGPLFEPSDPVFRSVQVAVSFFKVVVWYDGAGRLRTTAFRLSQVDLVGQIEFEALKFDSIFKTSQLPLAEIQEKTGLLFSLRMHETDTWKDAQGLVTDVLKRSAAGLQR